MSDGTPIRYNDKPFARTIARFIFASRWLQAPIYAGLVVAQLVYVVVFVVDLYHLVVDETWHELVETGHIDEATIMLSVLGLIDVAMVANLLIMVIIGGYETFVSKIDLREHPDEPEWLSHVNANILKVKLAMAIIGISSIHLLRTFIEVGPMVDGEAQGITSEGAFWQVIIHGTFILSALALAVIDRMQVAKMIPADAVPATRRGMANASATPGGASGA